MSGTLSHIREFVARTIETFASDDPRVTELALYYAVLPLGYDVGGLHGIRPDLSTWMVDLYYLEPGALKSAEFWEVDEPHYRDRILLVGASRYPELQALLPDRPSPAPICPSCDGAGSTCRICGGFGWIPERWGSNFIERRKLSWR